MRTLIRCIILLALVISTKLNSAAFAQSKEPNHSLEPSTWSLQFQISNDFTLRSFQGGILSAKYHFSKQRALRFGLAISGSFQDREQTNQQFIDDNLGLEREADTQTDLQSIDLITQYMFYSTPKRLNFYGGIGPIVGFSRNNGDIKERLDNGVMSTTKTEIKRWAIGVNTVIGGEWFAAKNISLLAEYTLQAIYDWRSDTQTRTIDNIRDITQTDLKRLILDAQRVRFGVSIYF
ncbi:hypothetical protein MJD09_04280 [bacterium]|nr:hypothetical protein [bacterium]